MKIEAEKLHILGSGHAGVVYSYKKDNGNELAIKLVHCKAFEDKIYILNEIKTLKNLIEKDNNN